MRTTILLMLFCAVNVSATTYAQDQKLNLNVRNASFNEVVDQLQKQSDFYFFYKSEDIPASKKITANLKNSNIFQVMELLLAGTNLKYKVIDKYIAIANKGSIEEIQQKQLKVTGKVTDDKGQPMTGVTVAVSGTTRAVITDINGMYSLPLNAKDKAISFSFIGMKRQEVILDGKSSINVSLESDTKTLEEVVVVGYGTVKKSDLTGAIASVSAEKLKERAVTNFGEALIGQIAGVQIQQINGAPGGEGLSIRIRGTGSITQSSDPLYVVDGYPMEGGAFRLLNPSDIESMQVLKDASSTAIYGSRGANGVVIINTKKGKIGAPVINFNMYTGVQQREKTIDMMNRDQYVSWLVDGRNQAWLDAPIVSTDPNRTPHLISDPNSRRQLYPSANTQYMIPNGTGGSLYNFLDPASVAKLPDNNWQNLLFKNAKMNQYELSISGGTEKSQYTFSTSYMNQDGISINTGYNRLNLRTGITTKINDRLQFGINMNAYLSNASEQTQGKYGPIMFALQLPPIYPLRNIDGTYGSMLENPEILAGDVSNPIGIAELIKNARKQNGWMGILFAEWEIIKDLKYKINVNGGVQQNNLKIYQPSNVDLDASKAPRPAQGSNETWNDNDWVIEQTLTYQKTFNELHNLTVLAGYTTQKHTYDHLYGESRAFPNDNIYTLNAGTMYQLTSDESGYSMISYLARVNYTFNSRYLLTATIRKDGSSRFGKNNMWGSFPSASIGWRVNQENFMKSIKVINDLKIRASFGITGNNRIGNYSSIGLLGRILSNRRCYSQHGEPQHYVK
jgi:TonB-linked SusC/RagA family outer membrane protein